jgi:hypothetical protein
MQKVLRRQCVEIVELISADIEKRAACMPIAYGSQHGQARASAQQLADCANELGMSDAVASASR